MHRSPATQRRRTRVRPHRILRRRAAALAVLAALVVLAVWAAYAIPGPKPARVPQTAAMPTYALSPASGQEVVIAKVDGMDLLLPLAREVTTAIAFHPVDNSDAVSLTPVGERLSGGGLGRTLADIFAGGGGVQYHVMDGDGGERSSSTAGLDVGGVPGSHLVSPVDGRVTAVKSYSILGRYPDVEINIQLNGDASLLLVVTHVGTPAVEIGEVVKAGQTKLGTLRGFPGALDQALSRYTSDNGDHVQMVVLRVAGEMAGL